MSVELKTPQAWPKTPINKRLLERVAHLTFPGTQRHDDIAGYALTDKDFTSDIVRFTDSDGNGHVTFWNDAYFNMSLPKPSAGESMVVKYPEPNSIGQTGALIGTIGRLEDPLGFQWLSALIASGNAPAVLGQVALTFDFSCSLFTVMDLHGVVWKWPRLQPSAGGDAEIAVLLDEQMAFSDKICFREEEREIVLAALQEIQQYPAELAKHVTNLEAVLAVIPLATMCVSTCTKSVSGWRDWLKSKSNNYEAAWLKSHLYKYLVDAARPLFADCSVADDNLSLYKEEHGL